MVPSSQDDGVERQCAVWLPRTTVWSTSMQHGDIKHLALHRERLLSAEACVDLLRCSAQPHPSQITSVLGGVGAVAKPRSPPAR